MSTSPEPTLADLRTEIDRIDSAMHELLIDRGRIIDRLIEIVERQHDVKVQDPSTFVAEILADMNEMVGHTEQISAKHRQRHRIHLADPQVRINQINTQRRLIEQRFKLRRAAT